jgi:hypothetical protein
MEYTAIEKACSVVPDEEKMKIRGAAYWSVPNRAFSDAAELRFTSKNNDKVHATISFLPPREVFVKRNGTRAGWKSTLNSP